MKLSNKFRNLLFNLLEQTLWRFGFDWRRLLSLGISIFGRDYFKIRHFRNSSEGMRAIKVLLTLDFSTVLDVGAGSGIYSSIFVGGERELPLLILAVRNIMKYVELNSIMLN
jgi:hypothetical protein